MNSHRPPAAHVRLAKKLAQDPCAILNDAEVRVLDRELWRATHWHALGERCRQARGTRGIRDVSVALGIPQYRLRAVGGGLLREVRVDLARRYVGFLGINEWIAAWCRANRDLAGRVGLLDSARTRSRRR